MTTYITSADYGDIRVSLGLAYDDTTTLPDTVIERRMFLPHVETAMAVVLTDCSVTWATETAANKEIVREAVVYWVASLLAERWMARMAGSQVKSQSLGPLSVSYEGGQNWAMDAKSLRYQAGDAMRVLCADAVGAIAGYFFGVVDDWDDSEPGDDTDDV